MDFTDNGLHAWEADAVFWDEQMGDESNFSHCDIVRPNVENCLNKRK